MAYRTHQEVSDTEVKVLSCFPENKVVKRMKLVCEFCHREKTTTETGYKEARGIWEIC